MGLPSQQPHEWIRGGTAKLLTLFHPATGELRGKAVEHSSNAVLHPWLKQELSAVLEQMKATALPVTPMRQWSTWSVTEEEVAAMHSPPLINLILVWDNLSGHYSKEMVNWCYQQGILLLYTPLGGSWLNMAESVQRIVVGRALTGQHLKTAPEVMAALEAAVRGWNHAPTPFVWGGKRAQRRQRARQRRHALAGSGACATHPIRRRRYTSLYHRLMHDYSRDK
jgi:hypothetical protein